MPKRAPAPVEPTRSRRAPLLALAALVPLLVPAAARAGDGALRLEVGGGADTNALRLAEEDGEADAFVSAVVSGTAAGAARGFDLRGATSLGARSYPARPDANLLATRLDLGAGRALSRRLRLDAALELRDLSEQGGWRDETGGRGALEATLRAGRSRVGGGGAFEADFPRDPVLEKFRWYGPVASLWVTTPAGESQVVRAGVDWSRRHYPRWDGPRDDDVYTASVEWLRRRPLVLGIGYSFSADFSTVRGGDHRRHRLFGRVAVTLPGDVTVAMMGSLQRSLYPDDVSIDQQVLLAQADASQNALELRVARPLGSRLELALTAAAYDSELNGEGVPRLPYAREVVGLALSWRAPGRPEVALPAEPRN